MSGLASQPWNPRFLLVDLGAFAGSSALAWGLLWYLHGAFPPTWEPLACGLLAGIGLRRWIRPTYAAFPEFLSRLFGAAVVLLGTVLCALATLGLYPLAYLVPRVVQAVGLLLFAVVLGLGLAALSWTHARYGREIRESEEREAALREEAVRAQLRALQAQIQPHFLFNAMNSLAELVHEDADAAEGLVEDLAHLLRYSLQSSAEARVPLARELEATERYLRVERARLGERLEVETTVAPGLEDALVPGLVLQPVVENAVRHAIAPRPEGGRIRIRVEAGDGALRIEVEDDGPGLPEEVARALRVPGANGREGAGTGGAGGGLANIARRLDLAYGGGAQIGVSTGELGGALFRIRVPL